MIVKKDVLRLERLAKRHRQLRKLKYQSEAEKVEIEILDKFFRSVEERIGDLSVRFSQLEGVLAKHGIKMTDTGVEKLH